MGNLNFVFRYFREWFCEVLDYVIYFFNKLKHSAFKMEKSNSLINLYKAQIKKIELSVAELHEDLQYDYKGVLDKLKN